MSEKSNNRSRRHYYVDESGDGVIFGRRGRILLGSPGVLRFFMLGALDVADPCRLQQEMEELRMRILADPYFRGVPSIQKTARAFHAKDDLPEVRREAFRLLLNHEVKFSAVVKDLQAVYAYVRSRNAADPRYRYRPDELYDHTARRLFKQRLHKDDEYRVFFARRGMSDRTQALKHALETARDAFCEELGIESNALLQVTSAHPHQQAGLQAADYFLWALQRLYNHGEERFISSIWSKVSNVIDVDDTRRKAYGEYYRQSIPISLHAIERKEGQPD